MPQTNPRWWTAVVFVRFHQGRRLTVGSLSTCLQLPPALRPRHGPVRNSPLTLRLVLYIYRAQLSRRVSLAECRVRASYRSAGPCHLLSTPAALTTPRRSRSRCDGLPQFNEDTGGPSCTLPENNTSELTLSYKTKNTLSIRNTKGESCSDVCWPLPGTSFTNQDTSLDLPQMFSSTSQHCPSSTRTAGVRQHPHQHVES